MQIVVNVFETAVLPRHSTSGLTGDCQGNSSLDLNGYVNHNTTTIKLRKQGRPTNECFQLSSSCDHAAANIPDILSEPGRIYFRTRVNSIARPCLNGQGLLSLANTPETLENEVLPTGRLTAKF